MIEGTTFDTIISWGLRSSFVLCLILIAVLRRKSPSSSFATAKSKLSSRIGITGSKSVLHSVDQRPLFRIKEGVLESSDASVAQTNSGPVFTKDSLLAARSIVSMNRPIELHDLGSAGYIRDARGMQNNGEEPEKEALQCLMQFRALKSITLKDATWTQWNEEARKILRGALALSCKNVSMEVYDTLVAQGILPDAGTFTLLVKTSLKAEEFRNAQFFVRKMSDSGHIPPPEVQQEVSTKLQTLSLNKHAAVFVPRHVVDRIYH